MGRALRSNVMLKLGPMMMVPVSIETAVGDDGEPKFNTLCNAGHPPTKTKQDLKCPECGNAQRETFVKGTQVGDSFVILDEASLKGAEAPEDVKGSIALTIHPGEEVDATTLPGGAVYYLSPGKQAGDLYTLVHAAVADHPELAFLAEFAVRGRSKLYRVGAFGDTLTLVEIAWPENVRPAPGKPGTVPEEAKPMLAQLLANLTQPFDVTQYRDKRADYLTAAVAAAEVVDGVAPAPLATTVPDSPGSMMDLLAAAVGAG